MPLLTNHKGRPRPSAPQANQQCVRGGGGVASGARRGGGRPAGSSERAAARGRERCAGGGAGPTGRVRSQRVRGARMRTAGRPGRRSAGGQRRLGSRASGERPRRGLRPSRGAQLLSGFGRRTPVCGESAAEGMDPSIARKGRCPGRPAWTLPCPPRVGPGASRGDGALAAEGEARGVPRGQPAS